MKTWTAHLFVIATAVAYYYAGTPLLIIVAGFACAAAGRGWDISASPFLTE